MKKIILSLTIAFAAITAANAQVLQSLDITPDARTAAMGGASIAMPAGAFSIYQNTAAIVMGENKLGVGYTYSPWAPAANAKNNLHSAAAYYKFANRHAVALGFRSFSGTEVVGQDGFGNPLPAFRPTDMAIDLGYAFGINDKMGISANVRYISSKISDQAPAKAGTAFGFDLGYYFRQDALSAAVSISNVGSKIDYGTATQNTMPAWAKVGAAYAFDFNPKNMLTASLQAAYMFMPSKSDANVANAPEPKYSSFDAGLGLEYMWNRMIALRAGYHMGAANYASAGVGVNLGPVMVDFAYLIAMGNESTLQNTWKLGLGLKF